MKTLLDRFMTRFPLPLPTDFCARLSRLKRLIALTATLLCAAWLSASPALAADRPTNLQPLPDVPPPPPMSATSEPDDTEPTITIREKEDTRYEEYRRHDRIYMVKVIPKVGKPYYLIDEQGKGSFVRSNQPVTRPPMWVIFEF